MIAVSAVFLFGCAEHGQVDQGRVVAFDKAKRVVTFIRGKADPANPDYSHLPPLTYTLPTDPLDAGPEPKAGGRMKLDADKGQVVIYDPAAKNFKTTDDGVQPGMEPAVLNEEGFPIGTVKVLASTETDSEAMVSSESGVKLGCLIRRPAAARPSHPTLH